MTNAQALVETRPVQVSVYASDPLTAAGIGSLLAGFPHCVLLPRNRTDDADVVVLGASSVTPELFEMVRGVVGRTSAKVVLVLNNPWPVDLPGPYELGLADVLVRSEIDPARLGRVIVAVARDDDEPAPRNRVDGHARISPAQFETLGSSALGPHGLNHREVEAIRLLASGMGIREIGLELSYSERTVKNILYALTTRLGLRNRTQAVAYAARMGAI